MSAWFAMEEVISFKSRVISSDTIRQIRILFYWWFKLFSLSRLFNTLFLSFSYFFDREIVHVKSPTQVYFSFLYCIVFSFSFLLGHNATHTTPHALKKQYIFVRSTFPSFFPSSPFPLIRVLWFQTYSIFLICYLLQAVCCKVICLYLNLQ